MERPCVIIRLEAVSTVKADIGGCVQSRLSSLLDFRAVITRLLAKIATISN